jgi:hypothetical protein
MAASRRPAIDATRQLGFSISTYGEDLVEDNARDRMDARYGDPEFRRNATRMKLIGPNGITERGWAILNEDIMKLERNALRWLRNNFGSVRDEGHDSYGDLVGVVWWDPRNRKQRDLVETGISERIDMTDSSYGNLANTVWEGVSPFGQSLLGGQINFMPMK